MSKQKGLVLALLVSVSINLLIAGFVLALVTIFAKKWSPITAPLYAICEGVFLGAISLVIGAPPLIPAAAAPSMTTSTAAS